MNDKKFPTDSNHPPVTSWNGDYVEQLYLQWKEDPSALPESWSMFFQGFEMAMCPRDCVASNRAHNQSQVASLIYAYRSQGHLIARTDPLGNNLDSIPDLDIGEFGFSESDLDEIYDTGHLGGPKRAPLRDIIQILKDTYCGSIGVQYTHIQSREMRRWLQAEMEPVRNRPNLDSDHKKDILETLIDADLFEKFIQTKFPGQKRFSLEGAETLIPLIHSIVEAAPDQNVAEIVIGMAHRGRLNVLSNILDKSYAMIFTEFEGLLSEDTFGGDGDVKYHMGFSSDHVNRNGKSVHLSLTDNPSHLEAVDPVVLGKVRAKQRQLAKNSENQPAHLEIVDRTRVLPILIHGDAAFSGQGIVAETFNLSQLKGYHVGGTVHIVVNNQIGFTTNPEDSRSTTYCTDVAKGVEAPIFHVNGDDPEAVVFITELALRFRQKFSRDVVVDMLCYRRHGHNEGDEPAFTQPVMYKAIKSRAPIRQIYTDQLVKQGDLDLSEVRDIEKQFRDQLQKNFEESKKSTPEPVSHTADVRWTGLGHDYSYDPIDTKVSHKDLIRVAEAMTTVPDGFNLNPKIARWQPERMEAVRNGDTVDWGFAESLAFGSLLLQGIPIRLSGQDSQRGTFSQRHAVWKDVETMDEYKPLNHIDPDQAHFCVYNSPLSEESVLGFDYGYTIAEPRMLIIWEAQFGDFANGAQMIIDQFITGSQSKWNRTSGLVMLLPHGYEGQGPEHSNAYLERYLQACAQENIQVCNLTTPAQYFHLLRRQVLQPFRRPLILMAPKSMLRLKAAVSPISDLTDGQFQPYLDDPKQPKNAKRLILCSGKLYYDLIEMRDSENINDVAIVRIEQLYPINTPIMHDLAKPYKKITEIVWAQEEPKNRGAWSFIRPWLQYVFPEKAIRYVGRGYAASPATGSLVRHREEQQLITVQALRDKKVQRDITILPEGAV